MPYRRHLRHFIARPAEVVFSLVVRTADNLETLGGGYVSVPTIPPITRSILDTALDAAVIKIAEEGNSAFPRDTDMSQAIDILGDGPGLPLVARWLREMARQRNEADRPIRRER